MSLIDAVETGRRAASLFAGSTTTTTTAATADVDLEGAHPYELQMLQSAGESIAPNNGSATDPARHDSIVSLLTASIGQAPPVTQGRDTAPASWVASQPSTPARRFDSNTSTPSMETRQRARLAVQWLEDKGYTREQAVGTVATLQARSDMNPAAAGSDGKSYGLAQWSADRQADFKKTFGFDIRGSTLNQQLAFVDWELRIAQSDTGRNLSAETTPQGAAEVVARLYEGVRNANSPDAGASESRRHAAVSHVLYRDMYVSGIGLGNAVDVANVVVNAPSATGLMTSAASLPEAQAIPAALMNSQVPIDVYTQPSDAYGVTNDLPTALHDQALAFQLNSGLR
ncbi:phage tail tip lysozyme [Bordetella sp. LUAb4]|uniref:phage tail tip lysozyme n=1 Tax=Bordetella sp. LUAb4 TaxID=2843195 RepID=UPI001E31E40D